METENEDAPLLGIMVQNNPTTKTPNGVGYGTHSSDVPNGSAVTMPPSSSSKLSCNESVTLSWENVSAFTKESRKGCRGLCCCRSPETSEKQILHNG